VSHFEDLGVQLVEIVILEGIEVDVRAIETSDDGFSTRVGPVGVLGGREGGFGAGDRSTGACVVVAVREGGAEELGFGTASISSSANFLRMAAEVKASVGSTQSMGEGLT
jgi:hypothetical protein